MALAALLCGVPVVAAAAPAERRVGGFTVADVRGKARPDGSFEGSGKVKVRGSALDAAFVVDGRGRIVRGTFKGELEASGRRFKVPEGTIDERGLHWRERITLPRPAPPVTVECSLSPSGTLGVEGGVEVPVAGVPVKLSVGLDSRGRWVARGRGDLALPSGHRLEGAELALSEDGFAGTGRLILGGGPAVDLALHVTPEGTLQAAAGVPVVVPLPGGRMIHLDGMTLVFGAGAGEARGTGDVRIGNVTVRDATFGLGRDGTVAGGGKVAVGGALVDALFVGGPAGLSVTGATSSTRRAQVAGATYEVAAEVGLEAASGQEPGVRARARGVVRKLGIGGGSRKVESEVDLGSGKIVFRAFGRRFALPLL